MGAAGGLEEVEGEGLEVEGERLEVEGDGLEGKLGDWK